MNESVDKLLQAIPFLPPRSGGGLGLLMAVTVDQYSDDPSEVFRDLHDGISTDTFRTSEQNPGEVEALLNKAIKWNEDDSLLAANHLSQAELGMIARIPQSPEILAKRESGEMESFHLKLANLHVCSLMQQSCISIIKENIAAFCKTNDTLLSHFDRATSRIIRRIDMVLGFVIYSVRGSCFLTDHDAASSKLKASADVGAAGLAVFEEKTEMNSELANTQGFVGACFMIVHLEKTHKHPQEVRVQSIFPIRKLDDPRFQLLVGTTITQQTRRLLNLVPVENQSTAFVIPRVADASSGDFNQVVQEHERAASETRAGRSLGVGRFENEGRGSVILDVDRAQPVYDTDRVENEDISRSYKGSWKWQYTAPVDKLSRLFEGLKKGPVKLHGASVTAMIPAIPLCQEYLLPIICSHVPSNNGPEIPGAVLRYEEKATILCPVSGVAQHMGVVTNRDKEWRVGEMLVNVSKEDLTQQEELQRKGFYVLSQEEADDEDSTGLTANSFITMGRQELLRVGELFDSTDEEEIEGIVLPPASEAPNNTGVETTGLMEPSRVVTARSMSSPDRKKPREGK